MLKRTSSASPTKPASQVQLLADSKVRRNCPTMRGVSRSLIDRSRAPPRTVRVHPAGHVPWKEADDVEPVAEIEHMNIAYLIDTIATDTAGTQKQLLETIRRLDGTGMRPLLICLWEIALDADSHATLPFNRSRLSRLYEGQLSGRSATPRSAHRTRKDRRPCRRSSKIRFLSGFCCNSRTTPLWSCYRAVAISGSAKAINPGTTAFSASRFRMSTARSTASSRTAGRSQALWPSASGCRSRSSR